MGRASVINDVEAFPGKNQVKEFKEEVMGADRGFFLEIIRDDQKEIMEGKGFLAQKKRLWKWKMKQATGEARMISLWQETWF